MTYISGDMDYDYNFQPTKQYSIVCAGQNDSSQKFWWQLTHFVSSALQTSA